MTDQPSHTERSTGAPEIRLDPRTGIFWQKVSEKGSVVTVTDDASLVNGTREVSYGTWITWDRLPQRVGDNGSPGLAAARQAEEGSNA